MTRRAVQLFCPTLIDRSHELDQLESMLDEAAVGQARAAIISGEAGIGKTRLCTTLCEKAAEQGAIIIACHAMSADSALPYSPIINGLRRTLQCLKPQILMVDTLPTSLREALSTILPEVESGLDNSCELCATRRQQPQTVETVRQRDLFDALVATFHALSTAALTGRGESAEPRLLVLLFEDLHWADDATIDFFQYLIHSRVRNIPGMSERLLVVGTYRSEEVRGTDHLYQCMGSILQQRLARHIELPALSEADHARLVSATIGYTVPPGLAALLFEHSEGNPFVSEELLNGLSIDRFVQKNGTVSMGDAELTLRFPLSLRTTVRERLRGLSREAQDVIGSSAIIGREFRFSELQAVTGLDEPVLLAVLHELMSGQHLAEKQTSSSGSHCALEDTYCFRHVLTREVLMSELLTRERRALHCRIADALEREIAQGRDRPELEPKLAHHLLEAGQIQRAQSYLLRVADRSLEQGAIRSAAEHLERALPGMSVGTFDRLERCEQISLLSMCLLEVPRAVATGQEARNCAQALKLPLRAEAIRSEIGAALWSLDPAQAQRETVEILSSAVENIDSATETDEATARWYGAVALCAVLSANSGSDIEAANAWVERSITLSGKLEPEHEHHECLGLIARGLALAGGETLTDALRIIRQVIEIGTRRNVPLAVVLGYGALIQVLQGAGRDQEAIAAYESGKNFERRTGAFVASSEAVFSYLACGQWSQGLEFARLEVDRFQSLPMPRSLALTALGHLLLAQGHLGEAGAAFDQAWEHLVTAPLFRWVGPCLWGMAKVQAARGDHTRALETYQEWRARWKTTVADATSAQVLLDACLMCAEHDMIEDAADWEKDLRVMRHSDGTPAAVAASLQAEGTIALLRQQPARALDCLRESVVAWQELGRPFDKARAMTTLGAALVEGADRGPDSRIEADRILRDAAGEFSRLGAVDNERAVVELRRQTGLLAQSRRRLTMAETRAPYGDLTSREQDVLKLLVLGNTNREIAKALFIAESTAEVHVSRILGKLGCTTRAQAAAVAVSRRLTSPEGKGRHLMVVGS